MDKKGEKRKSETQNGSSSSRSPHPKKTTVKTESQDDDVSPKDSAPKSSEQPLEAQRMYAELDRLRRQQSKCEEIISFMSRHWRQLNQELHTIVHRLAEEEALESMFPFIVQTTQQSGYNEENVHAFIQKLLAADSLETSFDSVWQSRAQETKSVLAQVVDTLLKQRQAFEGLRTTIASLPSIGSTENNSLWETFRKEFASVQQELSRSSTQCDILHGQVSELSKQLAVTSDQLVLYQTRVEENDKQTELLRSDLEAERGKIGTLKKQLQDKARESATLTYGLPKPAVAEVKKEPVTEVVCPKCAAGAVKSEPTEAGDELKNVTLLAEMRLNEIQELQRDIDVLREKYVALGDASKVTEEFVVKSPRFVQLVGRCRDLTHELSTARSELQTARAEVVKVKAESESAIAAINEETEQRAKKWKEAMEANAQHVKRLHETIEVVSRKYEQRKMQTQNSESRHQDLRKLLATQTADLKKLTAERAASGRKGPFLLKSRQRLEKDDSSQSALSSHQPSSSSSPSSTEVNLLKELEQMKSKEAEWLEREREMKLLLEVFQTRSKDSRELVEIRHSEKMLADSLEALKRELAALKEEHSDCQHKIERRYVEQYETVKKEKEELMIQLEKAESEARQAAEEGSQSRAEFEEMLPEFEQLAKAYQDMQEMNVKLLQQLNEKDDANTKLVTESTKHKQIQTLLKEERDALKGKVTIAESAQKALSDQLRSLEDQSRLLLEKLTRMESELVRVTTELIEGRKAWFDTEMIKQEFETKEKRLNHSLTESQRAQNELGRQLQQQQLAANRLKEQIALQKTPKAPDSVVTSEVEEYYQTKMKCAVCSRFNRDTTITKCGHTFCRGCVQANIATRNRKCPACGKAFGESDVLSIYF